MALCTAKITCDSYQELDLKYFMAIPSITEMQMGTLHEPKCKESQKIPRIQLPEIKDYIYRVVFKVILPVYAFTHAAC